MSIQYYDNRLDLDDQRPGFVRVERVYCLDWHAFTASLWEELSGIYAQLPGSVRYAVVPYWFGSDEDSPPWLFASVEPSGLLVGGLLRVADWMAWDEQFRAEAGHLPSFRVHE
jgi:hypothetical protein